MKHLRLRVTIHLNEDAFLTERNLKDMRPLIERGIAGALPAHLLVNTIRVTRLNEAAPTPSESKSESEPASE